MNALPAVVALGEILWDLVGDTRRLGGAPLNFTVQAQRLGHRVALISALGRDELGVEAEAALRALDVDTGLIQSASALATGTAEVRFAADGSPGFAIVRPAAYDAIELTSAHIQRIRAGEPAWMYFGTLFAASPDGRRVLDRLLEALPDTRRLFDLNLRPGSDAPDLAADLLAQADVVKLSDAELAHIRDYLGLPAGIEGACRSLAANFGLTALAVTSGAQGSAVLVGNDYAQAPAEPVTFTDTVGAGDAYTAAFMHGLSRRWPAREIAAFANRVAAAAISRPPA